MRRTQLEESSRAVRMQKENAPFPEEWPDVITDVLKEFEGNVLSDKLTEERRIKGEPMEIKLKENAVPFAVTGSKQIPFYHIKPGKQLAKELCEARVLEKTNEPTK